jgi:hypothetical protein
VLTVATVVANIGRAKSEIARAVVAMTERFIWILLI